MCLEHKEQAANFTDSPLNQQEVQDRFSFKRLQKMRFKLSFYEALDFDMSVYKSHVSVSFQNK